jgi:hypothetical protein
MIRVLGFGLALSAVLGLAAGEAFARGGGRKGGGGGRTGQGRLACSRPGYGNSKATMLQQRSMMQYRFRYGQGGYANQGGSSQQSVQGRRMQYGQFSPSSSKDAMPQQAMMQFRGRNGQASFGSHKDATRQRLRDGSCSGQAGSTTQRIRFGQGMRLPSKQRGAGSAGRQSGSQGQQLRQRLRNEQSALGAEDGAQ